MAVWLAPMAIFAPFGADAQSTGQQVVDFLTDGNDDPAHVKFGVGAIGVIADREEAASFSAEVRSGPELELLYVRPSLGLFVTSDSSIYGWFGLSGDIFFGKRWVLTPGTAVGFYIEGDGEDLGHPLEFRSGFEFAYRFDSRARLGLGVHHLSNAGISDRNPGTESVKLFYTLPFKTLF